MKKSPNRNSKNPESLEDCFLLDRRNEGCWSFLQLIIVHTLLGVGYTVHLADSQGNVKVSYVYSRPRSFFSYGGIESLSDFYDRRARVEQAVKKVPEVSGGFFDTREDEIKANMYQFRGRQAPQGYLIKKNVHTLACSWRASDLVPENPSPFQKMMGYLCFDWVSGLADVPPSVADDDKLYRALECGRDAINIAFEGWLARNSDILLVREVQEQMLLQHRQPRL